MRSSGRPETLSSDAFEAYYKGQQVVPNDEWASFLEALRTPIPVVVRVNRTKSGWQELHRSFADDSRWSPLPWFPHAWQCASAEYDDGLRTQCGALNKAYALRFQEASSLVPPLVLGVRATDRLLDLCAAPGSKTLECLEIMRESGGDEGVVVANDADAERCFELLPLVTRKARHPGTAVVLGSGAKFPAQFDAAGEQLLFDRVVCDVPCSGDGTLRRRPHCWKSWTPGFALTLHGKQLQILCRGLHLLRPGGRLVYSTCSLNPVENEAVVCAALERFNGDVALLPEAPHELHAKGLDIVAGLGAWRVPNPEEDGTFFESWAEVPAALRKPDGPIMKSMFSPSASEFAGAAHCIRLLPHRVDSSGFFVAVFVKREHRAHPVPMPSKLPDSLARVPWRARNDENRYEVIAPDAPDVRAIVDFYGLREVPVPLLAEYNIKGRLTQLNLVNDSLLRFLQSHLNCKSSPLLVAVGVPLFKLLDENFMTDVDVPSRWRPAMEGAEVLAARMAKRALRLNLETMYTLLARRLLPMVDLKQLSQDGHIDGLETCDDLLGGCLAGLRDGSFWAPCVITGLGLELYARAEELGEPKPVLAPPPRAPVLLEGPGFVALSKPPGLRTEDALKVLREGAYPHAELVSRLDKETSGCLLVAADAVGARALTEQFTECKVKKTYLALVGGSPEDTGVIGDPLALSEVGGGSRYRAYVATDGRPASTSYRTLWRKEGVSLVAAFPKTGRTHQIRCHFAHKGFPLVGDAKYGGSPAPWCKRLPLHCLRVRGRDASGEPLDVRAPLADDLAEALAALCKGGDASAPPSGSSEDWQGAVEALLADDA